MLDDYYLREDWRNNAFYQEVWKKTHGTLSGFPWLSVKDLAIITIANYGHNIAYFRHSKWQWTFAKPQEVQILLHVVHM